ncbi:UDP-N-acetylmuramoyl-L-alanyl-D-glutamate--2,6-diaminopimelate ligase [Vibrio coralliirubri]|uniref:Mur ligase family protein n=1 Tax=Vibrio coralliirubri TaxID=1516159 RepID=UPI0022844A31|nr:UDP-N-acetylmuramoyl-L-alanyl-D-glutamate--2,6-diaminopimelate ligase [Vibrio coralliirubri]MCY9861459.1 UDP-N-acetylmuramoyl-L-alanyl-D-glutamate--2,6-diaminopimelate ligase [Vibrio coralliirubri]
MLIFEPTNQLKLLKQLNVRSFNTNSAYIEPNDVFVCKVGANLDGHNYAAHAIANGAIAVISNREMNLSVPTLVTESYEQSLDLIKSVLDHPYRLMKHIGVTGTNGKTTVAHCLNQIMNIHTNSAYIGTLGANIGGIERPLDNTTPDAVTLLTLFNDMKKANTSFNMMELSSHALIQKRADFISLQVGVITNIGYDHIDFHKTPEDYVQAKLNIIDRLADNAHLVVNLNDPHAAAAIDKARDRVNVITFGVENNQADLIATDIESTLTGTCFTLSLMGEAKKVELPMPFDFNVENALSIAATLVAFDWTIGRISSALGSIHPPEGRSQFVPLHNGAMGLVDFAHNADAIEKLLSEAKKHTRSKLLVVLGVTGDRIQQAGQIGAICHNYADIVIYTSDNPMGVDQKDLFNALTSGSDKQSYTEADRESAIRLAKQLSGKGDLILVCGKGNETYQYTTSGKTTKISYIGDAAALRLPQII